MDAHEIERRLSDMESSAPRPALRNRILAATDDLLRPPAVDRLLARPRPWVLGLLLLVAFLVGSRLEDRRHEQAYRDLVGGDTRSVPDSDAIRRFLMDGPSIAVAEQPGGAR